MGGSGGFERLEIACWPAGGGERRRYPGVTHDSYVSIEHENRRFEGDIALVKRGLVLARNALRPYIV
jgi:hypothetical protein